MKAQCPHLVLFGRVSLSTGKYYRACAITRLRNWIPQKIARARTSRYIIYERRSLGEYR